MTYIDPSIFFIKKGKLLISFCSVRKYWMIIALEIIPIITNAQYGMIYGGINYPVLRQNTIHATPKLGFEIGGGLCFIGTERSEHWLKFGYQSNELGGITSHSTYTPIVTTEQKEVSYKNNLCIIGYSYSYAIVKSKLLLSLGMDAGFNIGNQKAENVDEYSKYYFYPLTSISNNISSQSKQVEFVEESKLHLFPNLGINYALYPNCNIQIACAPDMVGFFEKSYENYMGEVGLNLMRLSIYYKLDHSSIYSPF